MRGELQTQREPVAAPRYTQSGRIGRAFKAAAGWFNSEYLFPVIAIGAVCTLFAPIGCEKLKQIINVDRQGDPIRWETSAHCPRCGSWSFCNGAGTPYDCSKCGHSFTRPTH